LQGGTSNKGNYEPNFVKTKNMIKTLQGYHSYLCGEYRKTNTIQNHYHNAKRFLEHTHNDITPGGICQWRIWANNHYKRKNSLNSNINSINVYLRYSGLSELCMKTVGPEESNEYSLTEEEYKRLQVQSRQNIETALIFELLNHLVRPNEIINIKTQNRDKDILYLDDTKTGNNHVLINQTLQELWDQYLLVRPVPRPEYKEYLLIDNEPKWRGHKYKTTLPIRNRIYELGRQAGISKRVKPYTIKRTSITLRLDKTSGLFAGDLKIVQMMARHKKPEVTLRYDRKDDNDIRKYHNGLNNIETKTPENISDGKPYSVNIKIVSPQDLNNEDEGTSSYGFSICNSFFDFFNQCLLKNCRMEMQKYEMYRQPS